MTDEAPVCAFCGETPEDVSDMKLADNCKLSNGEPCSACQDYVAIEAQISATKRLLDDLMVQRLTIRSRVNQNHDLLTSRVPVEIVCSVFQFCVPADWDLDDFEFDYMWYMRKCGDDDEWMISGPMLLGSICKTWRTIAWERQSLWTVFRLYLNRNWKNPDHIALAREWLERAGQLPLSIRISDPDRHSNQKFYGGDVSPLISLVNERSKQWKNLDIIGLTWLIAQFREDAPNLQALRIGYSSETIHDPEIRVVLKDIYSRPWHLSLHDFDLDLPHIEYEDLTNVFLSRLHLNATIELLRRAPRVVYYKLHEIQPDTDPERFPKLDKYTIYEALESLEFGCPESDYDQSKQIMMFFQTFLFPSLKHLKIRPGGTYDCDPGRFSNKISWGPVVEHLENSSPPLISLSLEYLPFTKCTIPILKTTPLLQDLEILSPIWEGTYFGAQEDKVVEFIKLLAESSISNGSETDFLPNLECMKLVVEPTYPKDESLIWPSIPQIFGPISDIHNPRRRPLKKLQVRLMRRMRRTSFTGYSNVALEFSRIREEGIVLDLRDRNNNQVFQEFELGRSFDTDSESEFEFQPE